MTPRLPDRRPPGPFAKALAVIISLVLLVVGFMFSVILLAVAVVLVAGISGYLWWRTRELRRALREVRASAPPGASPDSRIFDGEGVRVDDDVETPDRRPPR